MTQDFTSGHLARQLGAAIRRERKAQGLRLVDLSLISGASLASLSNLETGGRDTRLSTYERVIDSLGTTIEELIAPTEDSQSGDCR